MSVRSLHNWFAFVGAVALGLGVSMAACGGSDDTATGPTTTVAAATTLEPTVTTAR